jgi:hypothetical protein
MLQIPVYSYVPLQYLIPDSCVFLCSVAVPGSSDVHRRPQSLLQMAGTREKVIKKGIKIPALPAARHNVPPGIACAHSGSGASIMIFSPVKG